MAENGARQLSFYKNRIKQVLTNIKSDLGESRYKLYMAMVDECNNYGELREMAELEMQIDFIKYTRANIEERLDEQQVDLDDLRKVYCENYEPVDSEEEAEGDDLESTDDDTLALLALAMAKRVSEAPISERDDIELTAEQEIDLMSDDEILDELEDDTIASESGESDDYDQDNDEYNDDESEYFSDGTDDDTLDTSTLESDIDNLGMNQDMGDSEDDSEESDEDDDYFDSDEDDDSEYFSSSTDDDTLEFEDDGEDGDTEADDSSLFVSSEDDTDKDADDADDIDDIDDYFSSDPDIAESDTLDSEIDSLGEDEDFFIGGDEEIPTDEDSDDTDIDDEDYFTNEVDDYFSGEDEEDEEDPDPFAEIDSIGEDEDDGFFDESLGTETDELNELDDADEELDEYFKDDGDSDLDSEIDFGSASDIFGGLSKTPKVQDKPREISRESVFTNPKAQGMFNLLNRGADKIESASKKAAKRASEAAKDRAKKTAKQIGKSDFYKLPKEDD